jgi:hypothetical protein
MPEKKEKSLPHEDPIVAEVRKVREALFAEADYDLEKFSRLLREKQSTSTRRVVTRPPRRSNDSKGEAA